jgi:hypothetical protein
MDKVICGVFTCMQKNKQCSKSCDDLSFQYRVPNKNGYFETTPLLQCTFIINGIRYFQRLISIDGQFHLVCLVHLIRLQMDNFHCFFVNKRTNANFRFSDEQTVNG